MEMNNEYGKDLSARVADIEKCIGDFAEIFKALKKIVNRIPGPDCPPYCMHGVDFDFKDPAKLEDRVADMCRFIGDYGEVFSVLKAALAGPGPDCPPYCAHGLDDSVLPAKN